MFEHKYFNEKIYWIRVLIPLILHYIPKYELKNVYLEAKIIALFKKILSLVFMIYIKLMYRKMLVMWLDEFILESIDK